MSDNVPFEIQVEIMNRLPVKSLIQFRSVCKSWKSLIDSSDFVACYSAQHTQVHHLLLSKDFRLEYVSIVDDDTFPQHKVSVFIPLLVQRLKHSTTVGCSHGLFCVYGDYEDSRRGPMSGTRRAIIWNPSIRKAVDFVMPNVANGVKYATILGFGVCGESNDPKIVKINQINIGWVESISCIPWQVEVFTLSTGAWRSPYSNLPRISIKFDDYKHVVVDGFLYWLAVDRYHVDYYNLMVSFDMTTEEFKEINLPDSLANQLDFNLSLSKLRNSLVVVEQGMEAGDPVFVVWMMEDGVLNVFTKLSDINDYYASIIGFRKNGEPICEIFKDDSKLHQLVVYEPHSKHIEYLGIDFEIAGFGPSFSVYPYMETLLLFDQPNLSV